MLFRPRPKTWRPDPSCKTLLETLLNSGGFFKTCPVKVSQTSLFGNALLGCSRILPGALMLGILLAALSTFAATNQVRFNRDIRPILSENCFACHGHDQNQRKAKLRLDVREIAIEKEAIVPGKPEQSKLVEHIFATDPDEIMPPPKSRKSLTAAQKEVLKQWIKEGAQYEQH